MRRLCIQLYKKKMCNTFEVYIPFVRYTLQTDFTSAENDIDVVLIPSLVRKLQKRGETVPF